jgi:hypothetical protein
LQSLATKVSDHSHLLLGLTERVHGKRLFHFKSFWPRLGDFQEVVENSWIETIAASFPLERISIKLQCLTRYVQSWSQKEVGHVKFQLGIARGILHRLEIAQDHQQLSSDEEWLHCIVKRHCLVMLYLGRTIPRLSSHISHFCSTILRW